MGCKTDGQTARQANTADYIDPYDTEQDQNLAWQYNEPLPIWTRLQSEDGHILQSFRPTVSS